MAHGLTIHKAVRTLAERPRARHRRAASAAGALQASRHRLSRPQLSARGQSGVQREPSAGGGNLTVAMHLVRALEQLQALILPAFIARPLLRHYPSPRHKLSRACHIYLGLLTG